MSGPRHGTRARYTAGCGCADCTLDLSLSCTGVADDTGTTHTYGVRRRREAPDA